MKLCSASCLEHGTDRNLRVAFLTKNVQKLTFFFLHIFKYLHAWSIQQAMLERCHLQPQPQSKSSILCPFLLRGLSNKLLPRKDTGARARAPPDRNLSTAAHNDGNPEP